MNLAEKNSICFISPFAYPLLAGKGGGPGGAERQFFLFGRELARRGWRVSFITEKVSSSDKSCKTEFPVFQADFSYMGGSNMRLPGCWVSLWRALKKADSTYYVIKTPAHLMLPVGLFARITGNKLLFWAQMTFGDNQPLSNNSGGVVTLMEKWGLWLADMAIAQTIDQKNSLLENDSLKVELVRSICGTLDGFPVIDSSHDFDTATDVDVLWVGIASERKRPEVIFELAAILPDVSFSMAMNKSPEHRLKMFKEKARDIPNLDFLGMVPPAEMESWFRRTRIYLNTSIREGFPNTFLQAWMNGVPVVSLNIDPDGIIEKYGLGYVVNKKESLKDQSDFKKLARDTAGHVENLLNSDVMRQEMGKRAASYVNENHLASVVVPKLINVLTF